jgi:succinate dehydrogenase hydrophobic anchor subunit
MFNSFLKMFTQGFLHWFTQRISAILLIISLIFLSLSNNLVLGLFVLLLIIIHFEAGIHTIVSDYMHNLQSKLISNVIIDLFIISLFKSIFIIFIYS